VVAVPNSGQIHALVDTGAGRLALIVLGLSGKGSRVDDRLDNICHPIT